MLADLSHRIIGGNCQDKNLSIWKFDNIFHNIDKGYYGIQFFYSMALFKLLQYGPFESKELLVRYDYTVHIFGTYLSIYFVCESSGVAYPSITIAYIAGLHTTG